MKMRPHDKSKVNIYEHVYPLLRAICEQEQRTAPVIVERALKLYAEQNGIKVETKEAK
jgi:hypothetical protein